MYSVIALQQYTCTVGYNKLREHQGQWGMRNSKYDIWKRYVHVFEIGNWRRRVPSAVLRVDEHSTRFFSPSFRS
jgi:hypothetical protein